VCRPGAGAGADRSFTLNRKGRSVPNLSSTTSPSASGCAWIQLFSVAPLLRMAGPLGCVPTLRRTNHHRRRPCCGVQVQFQLECCSLSLWNDNAHAMVIAPTHQSSANGLPSSTAAPLALASLATWARATSRDRAQATGLLVARRRGVAGRMHPTHLAASSGPAPGVVLRGAAEAEHFSLRSQLLGQLLWVGTQLRDRGRSPILIVGGIVGGSAAGSGSSPGHKQHKQQHLLGHLCRPLADGLGRRTVQPPRRGPSCEARAAPGGWRAGAARRQGQQGHPLAGTARRPRSSTQTIHSSARASTCLGPAPAIGIVISGSARGGSTSDSPPRPGLRCWGLPAAALPAAGCRPSSRRQHPLQQDLLPSQPIGRPHTGRR
jgi:hypothetical protein